MAQLHRTLRLNFFSDSQAYRTVLAQSLRTLMMRKDDEHVF